MATFWLRPRFVRIASIAAALGLISCLPPPGTGTTGDSAATSVPFGDANSSLSQGTAGASARQPFSSAQGSMTVSAASAPDLCLAISQPTATSSELVLRSCDASWRQRFVLVNGQLQSADGNCVMLAPGLFATTGNAVMAACDPNEPNQKFVASGGGLAVGTAAGSLALQSNLNPATTQSYLSFAPFVPRSTQQQWTLAQTSHNDVKAILTSGTHLVPIDAISSCLTGSGNTLVYQDCAPVNPNQAFVVFRDGSLRLGERCVSVTQPVPTLAACNLSDGNQIIGVKMGVLFSGLGFCVDRDESQPSAAVTKICDLTNAPHFVVGLSQ